MRNSADISSRDNQNTNFVFDVQGSVHRKCIPQVTNEMQRYTIL